MIRLLLLLMTALPLVVGAAETPVTATLVSERIALHPGENWLGVQLRMQPGWHVYWRNPGASGRAPAIDWQLPPSLTAGEMLWPVPEVLRSGNLKSYVYSGVVLLPVAIEVPASMPSTTLPITATLRWLACNDACIPGHATLSLTMPFTPRLPELTSDYATFENARAQLPRPASSDLHVRAAIEDGQLAVTLEPASALGHFSRLRWLPISADVVNDDDEAIVRADSDRLTLTQTLSADRRQLPEHIDGVLLLDDQAGTRALSFSARSDDGETSIPPQQVPMTLVTTARFGTPYWIALSLAFLGGLVLNLMPCVLPVLSMKALALMAIDPRDLSAHRQSALAYTAGVVGSCLALGATLLALRAAGAAVGWGFQLQSPVAITLLAYLFFAMALSLSGAVEFGVGWMGAGESLTQRHGWQGALFTGALAMVAASPCTAPFMGTALGYAMTQPPAYAMTIFAMLGLGLSSPFLLIAWRPSLAQRLPRPGAWMVNFRKAMAIPLYLTVVWLVWILARQIGADAVAMALSGFVALAVGLTLWQQPHRFARITRRVSFVTALALAGIPAVHSTNANAEFSGAHEPWSAARLAQLQREGKTVFVNFTADWCLTCKVNESTVLADARVRKALSRADVSWLTADWTRPDPAITAELARHGRDGVPLYLVYRPGRDPEVLPQILMPDRLLQSLRD